MAGEAPQTPGWRDERWLLEEIANQRFGQPMALRGLAVLARRILELERRLDCLDTAERRG